MVMSAYDLLRAKSIREEQPEDCNILLKDHIIQVIKRLEELYDYAKVNKGAISNSWLKDDKKRDRLFSAIAKGLFIHDLGKIDAGFQYKLFSKDDKDDTWNDLRGLFGWKKFPEQKIKRHEYLSIFWSYFLLDDTKEKEWNAKIRTAILFHHYNKFYTDSEKEFLEIIKVNQNASKDYLKFVLNHKDKLEEFLKSTIGEVKRNSKFDFVKTAMNGLESDITFNKLHDLIDKIKKHSPDIEAEIHDPETNKDETFVLMSGILKRCDHSASAEIPIEEINDISLIFKRIEENITKSIKTTAKEENFWQRKVLENNSDYPLLVAPTGSGKTEFALLWAKKQQRKLIYTLPLRVALNDLFTRFQNYAYINKQNTDENLVSLLHSTAFIEYLRQEKSAAEGALIDQKVHTSKNLASPLVLTTPDQILLTSLNFHGADRLKSIYPFSAIVVDEIQAYDPEMAAIIVKSLKDIEKLKGNILIMTATYPPYFEKFLSEFAKVEITNSQNIKNYDVKRHKVELMDASFELEKDSKNKNKKSVNEFEPSDTFREKIGSQIDIPDKNILIICNTVRKSIRVYDFLKNKYHDENNYISILHSRLIEGIKKDRVNCIQNLLKGKSEGKKSKRIILVATQIIEASVDVDFDVILTEISPIDSQIQRWGRVFRNRKDHLGNPLNYKEHDPNIIIFKKADRITNLIYDKNTIDKTIECLDEKNNENGFLDPLKYEDEKKLVEQTFSKLVEKNGIQITLKKYYEEQIQYLISNLEYFSIEKKSEAQRMFRKIAGLSFVFPDIMETDNDKNDDNQKSKLKKEFASIIKDKKNKDMSWKEIIYKIREKIHNDEDDKKLQLNLRQLLYQYSINIPIYHSDRKEGEGQYIYNHEFKGFYVFLIQENKTSEILEMGIDRIQDIDESYEKEFSNSHLYSSSIL